MSSFMNDALPTLPQPNFISCPYCENWQKLYSNWLGFCNLTDQLKSHALVGVQSQSVSLSQCLIAQTERSVLTKFYFTLSVRVNLHGAPIKFTQTCTWAGSVYTDATWKCNMSYERKFCRLSEYVQFQNVRLLNRSIA